MLGNCAYAPKPGGRLFLVHVAAAFSRPNSRGLLGLGSVLPPFQHHCADSPCLLGGWGFVLGLNYQYPAPLRTRNWPVPSFCRARWVYVSLAQYLVGRPPCLTLRPFVGVLLTGCGQPSLVTSGLGSRGMPAPEPRAKLPKVGLIYLQAQF